MAHRRRARKAWKRFERAVLRNAVIRRAAFVAGCATLILWGCYCIRDGGHSWFGTSKPPEESTPTVAVDRTIRVRLNDGKSGASIRLRVTSPCDVYATNTNQLLKSYDNPIASVAVSAAPGGIMLGGDRIASMDVIIKPKRDAAIVVGDDTYRGILRLHLDEGRVVLTNHVALESYLRGVLRGELPGHFHPEAFKAQCVAARTYAVYQKLGTPPTRDWDVLDHEGSQMYIGVRGEEAKSDAAVAATSGEICVYEEGGKEQIFCTYYSSTCGGVTQPISQFKPNDPRVPPLAGNIICTDCYLSRLYRWEPVKVTHDEVTRRIVARYPSVKRIGKIIRLRPKDVGSDGRIIRIQLDGSNGENETLVGEDFRLCIGGRTLKSTCFAIENGPGYFVFSEGKGFGHGCGLCQYGMETKALRGMTYREILSFYYPTSKIKKLYD